MAIRCYFPSIITPRKDTRYFIKAFKLQSGHVQPCKASSTLCNSSMVNKVFENREIGVVCYRDKSGEILCEGFDEGPRLCCQNLQLINHQRETQSPDYQEKMLLHIVEADSCCVKGAAVHSRKQDK
ncbi:uncharacterized protein [Typha latifolia]|uniref:uncharacterized protein n=1 Tax=Typha latifolia TaxID=4733 RepID=UPI003C2B5C33